MNCRHLDCAFFWLLTGRLWPDPAVAQRQLHESEIFTYHAGRKPSDRVFPGCLADSRLNLRLFRNLQRVIHLDAQVPDGRLKFGVAK